MQSDCEWEKQIEFVFIAHSHDFSVVGASDGAGDGAVQFKQLDRIETPLDSLHRRNH